MRPLIFLCLLLPVVAANAQEEDELKIPPAHYPALPKTGKAPGDFVPRGWKLEIEQKGDLNGDGINDAVLVLREDNPANVVKNDSLGESELNTNPRMLVVIFGAKEGGYTLAMENHALIPRHTVPTMDDVIDGVTGGSVAVRRGAFSVTLGIWFSAGSWSMGHVSHTFRWQNNRFELIGWDKSSSHRASGNDETISVNFSTRKVRIDCMNNFSDAGGRTIWAKLPKKKAWPIDAVGDGLAFRPIGDDVGCRESDYPQADEQ